MFKEGSHNTVCVAPHTVDDEVGELLSSEHPSIHVPAANTESSATTGVENDLNFTDRGNNNIKMFKCGQ